MVMSLIELSGLAIILVIGAVVLFSETQTSTGPSSSGRG
jgi:hypothetical protein